jgi:hypothetical protein
VTKEALQKITQIKNLKYNSVNDSNIFMSYEYEVQAKVNVFRNVIRHTINDVHVPS